MQVLPALRRIGFEALSVERNRRIEELRGLPEGSVFIWGDGNRHDESYYFTRGTPIEWKINVDDHTDTSQRFQTSDDVHLGNHMTATERDGVKISTRINSREKIGRIMERAGQMPDPVALTVDCDGIHAFPAMYRWISENTVKPTEVIGLIRFLGTRLRYLDIGGLIEEIPDFRLQQHMPEQYPTMETVRNFALGRQSDEVASYAFWTYAKIIEAYLSVRLKTSLG